MEKDFATGENGSPTFEQRTGSYGGGDRKWSAGRRMSAAELAAEAARRQSVAVNIVENPLKVGPVLVIYTDHVLTWHRF